MRPRPPGDANKRCSQREAGTLPGGAPYWAIATPPGAARNVRLLLDEMHAPAVAVALTEARFDVVAVAADPAVRGSSDVDLLEHATAAGRAMVTENVGDFSVLSAARAVEGESHAGLIFTNPNRFNRATLAYPGSLIAALRTFLEAPPVSGNSWIHWL